MTLMRTIQVNPAEEPFAMLSGKTGNARDAYRASEGTLDRIGHEQHASCLCKIARRGVLAVALRSDCCLPCVSP